RGSRAEVCRMVRVGAPLGAPSSSQDRRLDWERAQVEALEQVVRCGLVAGGSEAGAVGERRDDLRRRLAERLALREGDCAVALREAGAVRSDDQRDVDVARLAEPEQPREQDLAR